MRTAVAVTSEIDDLELASDELAAQIKEKLDLAANSVAVVFCDADLNVAELGALLHAKLGIDIAGLTTTATIERNSGYSDMGIVLSVMTADDVEFSVGYSGELDNNNFHVAICNAYEDAREKLHDDPKLILALTPYISDLTSENYMEVLEETSGGVPVFGGVATDHYDLQYQKTLLNGREFARGLVFILIAGNVRPVFSMQHRFGGKVEKKGVITKSKANLVERVGNQTFKEFVASMVPVPDNETVVIYHFQSTPFIMELPDYEEEESPVVRVLCTIDHETGAGGFLSKMPEGSTIYQNILQREHLAESCDVSLSALREAMDKNDDYEYSMVFITTCNARHLLMGDTKSMESDIVAKKLADLPPEVNAMGFYGFGEICPTGKRADGTTKNRFHNISFAICAI